MSPIFRSDNSLTIGTKHTRQHERPFVKVTFCKKIVGTFVLSFIFICSAQRYYVSSSTIPENYSHMSNVHTRGLRNETHRTRQVLKTGSIKYIFFGLMYVQYETFLINVGLKYQNLIFQRSVNLRGRFEDTSYANAGENYLDPVLYNRDRDSSYLTPSHVHGLRSETLPYENEDIFISTARIKQKERKTRCSREDMNPSKLKENIPKNGAAEDYLEPVSSSLWSRKYTFK
jgi:hypothetical protein